MNKPSILNVNKPVGITSYDVIRKLKKIYPGHKIGHAGTLDPLASGVLICLIGTQATRRQQEFMNADKEYEFEVLLGFETDTYDVLGFVVNRQEYDPQDIESRIHEILPEYVGEIEQKVPPFSAVKVDGKPLYRWYLSGRINEVKIPTKTVEIKELSLTKSRTVSQEKLRDDILNLLNLVKSGFRQKSVIEKWETVFKDSPRKDNPYLVVTLKATVSKGTYVRAIAHDLGQKLGIGGCTINITRTCVGEFQIEESKKLDEI